jgi:phenylacetate-CoA ligase
MRRLVYLLSRRAWWAWKGYQAYQIGCLLDESQWWPRKKLEEFRDEKLRRLIDHCYQHVPYYRRIMDERGLRIKDIESASDLNKLPVLTKSLVRANWADLRATNVPHEETFIAATGGTTGEPMKIVKHVGTEVWANMSFERGLAWGGLKPGARSVSLTGGSLWSGDQAWWRKLSGPFTGRVALPAFDLGQENLLQYAGVIRNHKAQFLLGYATTIYDLGRLLLESKNFLKLEAVFTTASQLYPEWADIIHQAMDCKVYSYYGCGECNSLGFQCHEGKTYHIPEEHVILEVETDAGQQSLVGIGEVLLTDLDNDAMPLLRYKNGDYLALSEQHCDCGRSLRLISHLEGRIHDFLYSTTGQRVASGISTVTMRYIDGIDEFQVRQDRLDHVLILVVARQHLPEDTVSYIRQSFRHYLGDQMDVEIRLVDNIPRTRAHKRRIIVNEMV